MCKGGSTHPAVGKDLSFDLWLGAEVEQKAHLNFCGLKVVDELVLVLFADGLRCFQLQDHKVVD